MSTLRELVVNIDFEGLDIRDLTRIDRAVDDIEDSFRELAVEINDVTRNSAIMGEVADNALEEIQMEAILASIAVDNMGDQFGQAAFKAGMFGLAATGAIAAIIVASAPILLATGVLAASFGAAGIAAVGFGAVAVGAIGQVFDAADEAAKLEEKIAQASNMEERIKYQKELAQLYLGMSKEQRNALKDLNAFKDSWGELVKSVEKPILKAFGNSLRGLDKLLTRMQPTISSVADVMVELTDSFGKELDDPDMKAFFDWMGTKGADSIRDLSKGLGNFTAGFMNMLKVFEPFVESFEKGFVDMSQRFREWAAGLDNNKSFQNFLEYAKTNGPVLWETITNIGGVFEQLIQDLAPIGTIVLDAFKNLTGFINDNWTAMRETIIGAGVAVGTFVGIMKGMEAIALINTLVSAWRAGTLLQTVAQWGLNAAMLANPLTWIAAGIAVVVGAGVLLYRNWDTVKEKAGQLWSWLKEKFGGIKDSILSSLKPIMDMIDRLVAGFGKVKEFVSNFDTSKYWGMFTNGVSRVFGGGVDGSHASGLAEVKRNGYVAELHKGEAVVTANQANALKGAGILGSNGNKPTVNIGGGGASFAPSITINVDASGGGQANPEDIKQAVRREMERFWLQMSLKQA